MTRPVYVSAHRTAAIVALLTAAPDGVLLRDVAQALTLRRECARCALQCLLARGIVAFSVPRSSRGVWCLPAEAPRLRAVEVARKRAQTQEMERRRWRRGMALAADDDAKPFSHRIVTEWPRGPKPGPASVWEFRP